MFYLKRDELVIQRWIPSFQTKTNKILQAGTQIEKILRSNRPVQDVCYRSGLEQKLAENFDAVYSFFFLSEKIFGNVLLIKLF